VAQSTPSSLWPGSPEVVSTEAPSRSEARERPEVDGLAWAIHDRTHLELDVVYPVAPDQGRTTFEWETYFFVPESFELPAHDAIGDDFRSRVRRAVDATRFATLPKKPLAKVTEVLGSGIGEERALRLYACQVQRTAIATLNAIGDGDLSRAEVARNISEAVDLVAATREALEPHREGKSPVAVAVRWTDEYVSLTVETFLDKLAIHLDDQSRLKDLHSRAVEAAVEQARYRRRRGYESVLDEGTEPRAVERFDFWLHTLKRYASSVLWLDATERDPRRWIRHLLYGLAAGVAMAFAVGVALWNGATPADRFVSWLLIAVVAYVIKDRMKAGLQGYFGKTVFRRMPDRRWLVNDPTTGSRVAVVDELTRFADDDEIEAEVLQARRRTSSHRPAEELARPRDVLIHRKRVTIDSSELHRKGEPYSGLVEVCRVDLSRWLVHTDDPKHRIVYADPSSGEVGEEKAPRVYNVDLVHRLRVVDGPEPAWRHSRAVVSRKGIRRLDHC
jgi:hypothetical protein